MTGTELDPDGTDSFHPDHPWEQTAHPLYVAPSARTTGNWPPVAADPAGPHEAAMWAALPHGHRGHMEPTAPTREQIAEALTSWFPEYEGVGSVIDDATREIALLSQPTPLISKPHTREQIAEVLASVEVGPNTMRLADAVLALLAKGADRG